MVSLESDRHFYRTCEHDAVLASRMTNQRSGRRRRATRCIGHVEEVHQGVTFAGETFPLDTRGNLQSRPVAPGLEPRVRIAVAGPNSRGSSASVTAWVAIEQFVERNTEGGCEGVQRLERRLGFARLDLRQGAWRYVELTREFAEAQVGALSGFAKAVSRDHTRLRIHHGIDADFSVSVKDHCTNSGSASMEPQSNPLMPLSNIERKEHS